MYPGQPLDCVQLLRHASAVLQSRMPAWNGRFRFDFVHYRARFDWPGVVTVSDDNTGETLARSVPGKPFEPDAETKGRTTWRGAA